MSFCLQCPVMRIMTSLKLTPNSPFFWADSWVPRLNFPKTFEETCQGERWTRFFCKAGWVNLSFQGYLEMWHNSASYLITVCWLKTDKNPASSVMSNVKCQMPQHVKCQMSNANFKCQSYHKMWHKPLFTSRCDIGHKHHSSASVKLFTLG